MRHALDPRRAPARASSRTSARRPAPTRARLPRESPAHVRLRVAGPRRRATRAHETPRRSAPRAPDAWGVDVAGGPLRAAARDPRAAVALAASRPLRAPAAPRRRLRARVRSRRPTGDPRRVRARGGRARAASRRARPRAPRLGLAHLGAAPLHLDDGRLGRGTACDARLRRSHAKNSSSASARPRSSRTLSSSSCRRCSRPASSSSSAASLRRSSIARRSIEPFSQPGATCAAAMSQGHSRDLALRAVGSDVLSDPRGTMTGRCPQAGRHRSPSERSAAAAGCPSTAFRGATARRCRKRPTISSRGSGRSALALRSNGWNVPAAFGPPDL